MVARSLGVVWLCAALACTGGDDPAPTDTAPATDTDTTVTDTTTPAPADPVQHALEALGVDTTPTPRVDPDGDPLPAAYAPLGSRLELGRIDELFVVGAQPAGVTTRVSFLEGEGGNEQTLSSVPADPPWASHVDSSEGFPQTPRAATAGDVDGDGVDEALVVYVDPAANTQITLARYEDAVAALPFAPSTAVLAVEPGVLDVAAASGDLDGDTREDLVIGLSTASAAKVLFARSDGAALTVDAAATLTLAPDPTTDAHGLRLVTGNLDYDPGDELVVVMNEVDGATGGRARYWVYDDAGAGHAELDAGSVTVVDGSTYTALVLDAAIGDIDGDHLGEVVLAGLSAYRSNTCDVDHYVGLALDDAAHGLAANGSKHWTKFLNGCDDADPTGLRFAYVNALDVDADGLAEIAVNNTIYEDWAAAPAFTTKLTVGEGEFISDGEKLDRNSFLITAGNVDGNVSQDLILFNQQVAKINVWGIGTSGFARVAQWSTSFLNAQTPLNAAIVALNLDDDTPVLAYGEPVSQLVFTEPIVIAALASSPCYVDPEIGQYLYGCATQFGTAESQTVSQEDTVSLTAGATVGFGVEFDLLQSGIELTASLETASTEVSAESYQLSKSIVYTSAGQEDTVIFTTIPYDQYRYTVLAHHDPTLVGQEVVIGLPRSPITLMTEREFYNASVPPGSLQIGSGIFPHTVGDPTTYMDAAAKNQILNDGTQDPALQNGPRSVGQGAGGFVTLGIEVGQELASGSSFEIGWVADVRATAGGVIAGFSVGQTFGETLTVSMGESTMYSGSIGALPAEVFSDLQYEFGVFAHVARDPATGREYQVVNYWVE